jgi:hypothetical protein
MAHAQLGRPGSRGFGPVDNGRVNPIHRDLGRRGRAASLRASRRIPTRWIGRSVLAGAASRCHLMSGSGHGRLLGRWSCRACPSRAWCRPVGRTRCNCLCGRTRIVGASSADMSSRASCRTRPSVGNASRNSAFDPQPSVHPDDSQGPHLEMHGFLVTRWAGEPVNAATEEQDDPRWFRPSDLATSGWPIQKRC